MARIFKTPFAAQGDKDTIPTPTQGDGSVSITQGFGFDYQREYEDPLAKDIRREDINGILHDITEAVGDIQLTGVAKWSADAAPYPPGAVVWHNDAAWLSLAENNSVEPAEGANWARQRPATLFVEKSANLSDLANAATARSNLGLGNSATRNVGTGSNTVAAGNDSRITGAAQKSANLSDLTNAATARANIGLGNNAAGRANLGLGDSATRNVGTTSGTVAAGNDSRITGAAQKSANLSDLANAAAARSNLGLGSAATRDVTTSNADVTAGRLLKVGDLGSNRRPTAAVDFNALPELYPYSGAVPVMSNVDSSNVPPNGGNIYYHVVQHFYSSGGNVTQIAIPYRVDSDGMWMRSRYDGTWSPWREIYHSGNLNPVDTSRQIIAGTGLTGGGNLSANRTLSLEEAYWPLGVGQTWQDMTADRTVNTNYTNTTNRPIQVSIYTNAFGGNTTLFVNGIEVCHSSVGTDYGHTFQGQAIVPSGAVYRLTGAASDLRWRELR